jgi:hypothetical protein
MSAGMAGRKDLAAPESVRQTTFEVPSEPELQLWMLQEESK